MRVFTILLYHKNIVQVKSKIRQLEELEIAEIWSKTLLFLQYVETESVPNNARADAEHQNLLYRPNHRTGIFTLEFILCFLKINLLSKY